MNTVTLLRRHRPACKAKYPVGSCTTENEESRRNWKKCTCKIYAHGTLDGVFHRLATKARDWERAREALAPYLAAGSWEVEETQPPPPAGPQPGGPGGEPPTPGASSSGTPIPDAVEAHLKNYAKNQSAPNTLKKYTEVMGQFERYSAHLGLRYVEEWTRPYVRQLVASWGEAGNCHLTVRIKLGVVKTFFEPFVEDHVLAENPARIKIKRNNRASRQATTGKQKNPFTDSELERMLAGCARIGRPVPAERLVPIDRFRNQRPKWSGEDIADFIEISVYTGLRISDVATFHVSRLTPAGEVNLRATKNGNWVSVWIPEWLRQVIRARSVRVGPLIFGTHSTTDINVITEIWRRKLNKLWAKSGPWDEKPTPHRFRHTFVRILLERHTPVELIAELVGDTEQMIRKHYSAWVPGRQENASRILAEAFRNVPRFHR